MEDDDHISLSHGSDDYESGSSLLDDDSIASEESFGSAESVGNYGCADRPESSVESEYSCFTTGQMCVTSLMYLMYLLDKWSGQSLFALELGSNKIAACYYVIF